MKNNYNMFSSGVQLPTNQVLGFGNGFASTVPIQPNSSYQQALDDYIRSLNIDNSYTPSTGDTNSPGVMGYLGAGAGILQGLSGLANAYMGYKNYKLAKKQFGFQKGLANRNLANQAKVINNTYDNAAQVAAGMIGGGSYNPATDSQGSYGMTDQAIVDRYAQKAKEKHVDGSPV